MSDTSPLIPLWIYIISTLTLSLYILLTGTLCVADGSFIKICFTNGIFYSMYLLAFPSWMLIHVLIFRCFELVMELQYRLYSCFLGVAVSLVSTVLGTMIAFKAWKCSGPYYRTAFASCILISVWWCGIWVQVLWKRFFRNADETSTQSLLIMIRCGCIPPWVKKCVLVSPYYVAALYQTISTVRNWSHDCSLPYHVFCAIGAIIFMFMGFSALLLLFQDRHNHQHQIMLKQQADDGLLNSESNHSSVEAGRELPLNNSTMQCYFSPSLTVVWYLLGFINTFGLLWACVGFYWLKYRDSCDHDIVQEAVWCGVLLATYSTVGTVLAFLLKLESCFPSVLDPSLLHAGVHANKTNDVITRLSKGFRRDILWPQGQYMKVDDSSNHGPGSLAIPEVDGRTAVRVSREVQLSNLTTSTVSQTTFVM
mmetsp:Transcript_3748/g.5809  ORF Transcript_3748/g.5809 Transcript_3748/m.5809 type:complete len:423 (+) Transcript_3748:77-1345(+)